MGTSRPWTKKEVDLVVWWRDQGVKVVVAAQRLGRTPGAVTTKLRDARRAAGVPPRWTPHRRGELSARVAALAGEGISDSDVARVLDVSRRAVSHCRRALGIPPGFVFRLRPRGAWKPGDPGGLKAAVVRLYGRWGRSDAEIAALTGEPRFRVTYYREKMGIPACGRAGRPPKPERETRCPY